MENITFSDDSLALHTIYRNKYDGDYWRQGKEKKRAVLKSITAMNLSEWVIQFRWP